MAKNDVVLIDAIIDDRTAANLPSNRPDEVFEYFSFEQVLKDFDLSRDEIELGWVDGRNDGGIDGFFTFINGHLLQDPKSFIWPRRGAEVEVYVLTCKHHDTFQQAPLNAILASLTEIFDFSSEESYLQERYSPDLLSARHLLLEAYKQLSSVRPTLKFTFCYISRGDANIVGESVLTRSEQIVTVTEGLFSQCRAEFSFIGAAELISLYRRTRSFNFDLCAIELMTTGPGNYVAIVRLQDYKEFVTDESGSLRRYLFDSNVRDYLGDNRVNEDIGASLADPAAPEFWWLNNGVTLLATNATAAGKVLSLQDIQIVNGLQTTESIFRHFQSGSTFSIDRGLLVKVVVSTDAAVRDQIIRATNNQSLVETASLHATDKLQRDIEEILERHDWYYERRKNYYRNIGKPASRFVTPLYLAAGYIALVMKNPAFAARLKSRFMRTQEGYDSVFSATAPLQVWVTITEVLKRVEVTLSDIRLQKPSEMARFLSSWRNLVALLVIAKTIGTFSFGYGDLNGIDLNKITDSLIRDIWRLVESVRGESAKNTDFRRANFIKRCCEQLNVTGLDVVGQQRPKGDTQPAPIMLTEEFISLVNATLPAQPWKRGMHLEVTKELKCTNRYLAAAISELIARGIRMQQKDGVVYDPSGKIVAIDPERVPAEQVEMTLAEST